MVLPMTKKWYELVKSGEKTHELRAANTSWSRRLDGAEFAHFQLGCMMQDRQTVRYFCFVVGCSNM